MKEIKKIIWGTDGSKESEEALNYAVFLAKKFNSEIIGVSVIPMPEQLIDEYFRKSQGEVHDWTVKVNENIESRLTSISSELASQGVSFKGMVLEGEPNKEIVGLARRERADLIVMGKRGHGLMGRILTGSNTLKVLRESSVPVVAVKKSEEGRAIEIRNILVPLDINQKVDSALDYAVDLAERINASISVLYVFKLVNYTNFEIPPIVLADVMEGLMKSSLGELAKRVEKMKLRRRIRNREIDKLEINTEVIQGISTSATIVDYATNKNTDLIVINTHGKKGIKKFVLGSVAEKVIQESPCTVLTLKP
jgi:nucleotide-binding universal stress UspA family protein